MLQRIEQLFQHQQLLPFYLISSEEPLLTIEAQDFIRQLATEHGYSERQSYSVDKSFDWSLLSQHSQTLSLFAEKKLIELTFIGKTGKDGSKYIRQFVDQGIEDICFVVYCSKLDKAQQKSAWVRAISSAGFAAQIWGIKPQQMPQWINQRAQRLSLTMDSDACQLLASYTEGNLLAAHQALQKLDTRQVSHITVDMVKEDLANQAKFNIYELFETAIRQPDRAIRMLNNLQFEGVDTYPILWTLSNELKQALQLQGLISAGESFSSACNQLGIWRSKQNALQSTIQQFNISALSKLLKRCQKIDLSIKGLHKDDAWRQLKEIILILGRRRLARP